MKKIIIIVLVIAAIAAAAWFMMKKEVEAPEVSFENATTITFSADTGETVDVSFVGAAAALNGLGMTDVRLMQVEAASGAKYQNEDGSLVVWNQGDEVTVYQNDEAIFTGIDVQSRMMDTSSTDQAVVDITSATWVWMVTELADGTVRTPSQSEAFTITFGADGTVSGTTDCNNFTGSYTLGNAVLAVGPLAMTKMACPDSQEAEFIADVSGTTTTMSFNDAGNLVLNYPYNGGTMQFARQTNPVVDKLMSTTWVWQETRMSDDATIVPNQTDMFTLTFADDTVSVGTDCNNASGQYSLTGNQLQIGPNLAMTMRACEGSQESEFIQMISQSLVVVETDATQLILDLPVDSGQMIFVPKAE